MIADLQTRGADLTADWLSIITWYSSQGAPCWDKNGSIFPVTTDYYDDDSTTITTSAATTTPSMGILLCYINQFRIWRNAHDVIFIDWLSLEYFFCHVVHIGSNCQNSPWNHASNIKLRTTENRNMKVAAPRKIIDVSSISLNEANSTTRPSKSTINIMWPVVSI